MKGITLIIGLALLGLLAVVVMAIIGIYNKLVTLRNRFKNAWAQIDVQLKRRYDLIPNRSRRPRAISSTNGAHWKPSLPRATPRRRPTAASRPIPRIPRR